jgi:hypothetical protein
MHRASDNHQVAGVKPDALRLHLTFQLLEAARIRGKDRYGSLLQLGLGL